MVLPKPPISLARAADLGPVASPSTFATPKPPFNPAQGWMEGALSLEMQVDTGSEAFVLVANAHSDLSPVVRESPAMDI